MDRAIPPAERRRRAARRLLGGGLGVAAAAALLLLLPGWLRPSLARDEVRIARVERGPVEAGLTAAGTVLPASETALSSPVEARVVRVGKRAGDRVRRGEEIVELDTGAARLELLRIEDRLAQKQNERGQKRLALDRRLIELEGQLEAARLDAEVLRERAAQNRRLREEGLISDATLRLAEVEAKKADIAVRRLERTIAGERQATAAELEALALDLSVLGKERDASRRQLELATARADRDGVLTWVLDEVGVTVPRGQVVARIADLGSFRVEAMTSDVHAARLAPGLPVRVTAGDAVLRGAIASVDPTMAGGAARFTVALARPDHPALFSNLRVDVQVVTGRRAGGLRVARGPFARGGRRQPVFVVAGDYAVRRQVRFGLAGAEHLEVLSGLAAGEEVIVSDVRELLGAERIALR